MKISSNVCQCCNSTTTCLVQHYISEHGSRLRGLYCFDCRQFYDLKDNTHKKVITFKRSYNRFKDLYPSFNQLVFEKNKKEKVKPIKTILRKKNET